MVKINLSRILGERRITQAKLARLTGIRPSTISEWYNEIVERISLDHLNRICEALGCSSTELMEYIPDSERSTGKDLIVEEHGNRKHRVSTKN